MPEKKRKILVLASAPTDLAFLRLDQEVSEIGEGLRRSKHRDRFELAHRWAVGPTEIRRALLDEDPQIVHFCGHGEKKGLMVEDDQGFPTLLSNEAIAGLFAIFADKIECVVLNACWSQAQAKAINGHVGYVIGMSRPIGDKAAMEFAVGFYDGLGGGKSIEEAFKIGVNAIQAHNLSEHQTPILLKNAAAVASYRMKSKARTDSENGGAKALTRKQKVVQALKSKTTIVVLTAIPVIIALSQFISGMVPKAPVKEYLWLEKISGVPDTLFLAQALAYRDSHITVELRADPSKSVTADLSLSFNVNGLASGTSLQPVKNDFKGACLFDLDFPNFESILGLDHARSGRVDVKLGFKSFEEHKVESEDFKTQAVYLIPKNYLDFDNPEQLKVFLTPNNALFAGLAKDLNDALDPLYTTENGKYFGVNFVKAAGVYYWMKTSGLTHVPKFDNRSARYLQYPVETLTSKAGNGNDLAVLFATILLALDVPVDYTFADQTNLVLYFDTGIHDPQHPFYPRDAQDRLARRDMQSKAWLPLNLSDFENSFYGVWRSSRFYDLAVQTPKPIPPMELRGISPPVASEVPMNEMSMQQLVVLVSNELTEWKKHISE